MAFPNPPSRTPVAEPNILPTVTLAPPLELVPSRTFHVNPFALIPLVISCLIMCATATYAWKLWQREDKYYVEEDYSDEEYEDLEATAIDPGTVSGTNTSAEIRERQPGTPESLVAAREEARAAVLRSGISRPFAARTMPLNVRDQVRTAVQTRKHGGPNNSELVQIPEPTASPPASSKPPADDGTTNNPPATDDAASYRSTDTWERNSNGSRDLNGASAGPSQVPVQEAIRSAISEAGTESTGFVPAEHDLHRLSGIDWKDDGSSIYGSEFTKYGVSEFGRSSYTNRYEDY
ncbi:hypothetical protein P171DRAFT_489466 [Karstenula rhodostoma CBS 690.94]|uniref:Uncharacterized protein n=1 Tax=Karstenula rhodostoma CBS 690.94 TaxID=1392251 RepID=A0A9P4PCZ1_9PLEO|nr:hypothetical protein P171DRAFT_489466 [Karstenula rhodostoma CBS 690.94]